MSRKRIYCENCIDGKDSIFNMLDPEDKQILHLNHSCTSFKKGEIIYRQGDKPTGLICLSAGKVKVLKEGVGGREQIVRMSKPVGFIGYRALFAGDPYMSSAVAIEDSKICIIQKEALFDVLERNGSLGLAMLREMAVELGFSNERTVNLTQKHIRGRLAESLVFLIETFGFEDDKKTIKVYLSREDLANLSNMTTSNAIRTLSMFANEDVIVLEGKKIRVIDIPKLKRISKLG
ncbi:MAG: Crp/Fnr family transcriptional regulator [Bacteroidales bacterium]|nr:Crp/Fnr family transcriptional regulator [Bacteroidales bacterium]